MKKIKIILIAVVLIAIVAGLGFFLMGKMVSKNAGILIETTPVATVYMEGEQVGRTPYEATVKPGEVVIKLVPDSFDKPLAPYETKISLVSGVKTIIQREFGDSEETSSGAIISFEKVGGKDASLSVVSIPDSVQVSLNGQIRGFSPYKSSSLQPGEHILDVTAPGFGEKSLNTRVYEGYKLTAFFKLAPNGQTQENETPEALGVAEEKKDMVEIVTTPTGYLRVRQEASTSSEEVGRVNPGEKYEIVEEDEDTGWYKIEYEQGKMGWVTNQYAKRSEAATVSPSPTSTPAPSASPKVSPTP